MTDPLNKACHPLAASHPSIQLTAVEEAPALVIDDRFEPKLSLLCNEEVHFLADCQSCGGVLNPAINARRACRPTLIIEIDLNHGERACPECVPLLAKGYKEVFTESPISEGAQMIHFANLQPSDFSNGDFRALIRYVLCVIVVNRRYLRKRQCALVMRWA